MCLQSLLDFAGRWNSWRQINAFVTICGARFPLLLGVMQPPLVFEELWRNERCRQNCGPHHDAFEVFSLVGRVCFGNICENAFSSESMHKYSFLFFIRLVERTQHAGNEQSKATGEAEREFLHEGPSEAFQSTDAFVVWAKDETFFFYIYQTRRKRKPVKP